ncbi:MAG: hypothetical protein FWD51_00565 [Betaproteobacteria bacterium]|nr:hypothetical protein [Betaproteobacteria bacterium]
MKATMETEKIQAEIANLSATTAKLNAETVKIMTEAKWYPFVAIAALFAAAFGIVKLFL